MKATEQYFPVVLFIMLYKEVLTFESVDESLSFTIQMNGTEQFFPREVQKALTSDSRCLNFPRVLKFPSCIMTM